MTITSPARALRVRDDAWLTGAATCFTVAVLVHNADHVRRGADAVRQDVLWAGTAAIVLEVAIVLLVCQRHRSAPLVALAGGFSLAVGYVVVHFLPGRSWLSDSFPSAASVSWMSWFAASFEVFAALLVGVAGVVAVQDRGGIAGSLRPRDDQRSFGVALRHPLVVAMLLGNLVVLVLTFTNG